MSITEHTACSAAETEAFAATIAARLRPGDRILLEGELGAGKTTFVRGVVRALGGDAVGVSSPTFAIHHQYPTPPMTVDHIDLYRLAPAVDLNRVGLDLVLEDTRNLVLCEWAGRLAAPPPRVRAVVTLTTTGEDRRSIAVRWCDGGGARDVT